MGFKSVEVIPCISGTQGGQERQTLGLGRFKWATCPHRLEETLKLKQPHNQIELLAKNLV